MQNFRCIWNFDETYGSFNMKVFFAALWVSAGLDRQLNHFAMISMFLVDRSCRTSLPLSASPPLPHHNPPSPTPLTRSFCLERKPARYCTTYLQQQEYHVYNHNFYDDNWCHGAGGSHGRLCSQHLRRARVHEASRQSTVFPVKGISRWVSTKKGFRAYCALITHLLYLDSTTGLTHWNRNEMMVYTRFSINRCFYWVESKPPQVVLVRCLTFYN